MPYYLLAVPIVVEALDDMDAAGKFQRLEIHLDGEINTVQSQLRRGAGEDDWNVVPSAQVIDLEQAMGHPES